MSEKNLTEEELEKKETDLRKEVSNEVFDGEAPVVPLDEESNEIVADEPIEDDEPEDPLAGLDPALIEMLNGINSKLSSLDGFEDRIKQTEKRVGGITNKLHTSEREAAAAEELKKSAPTEEELENAKKSKDSWEKLQKEFPDWAVAIQGKIEEQTKDKVSSDSLTEKLSDIRKEHPTNDENEIDPKFELRLLKAVHPDFVEVTGLKEYKDWLDKQPDEVKQLANYGKLADDGIHIMNLFKNSEPVKNSNKKKKRLASSVTTKSFHKTIKPKTQADMNEAELRRSIASEVFD